MGKIHPIAAVKLLKRRETDTKECSWHRRDCVHLSPKGLEVFLSNIKGFLQEELRSKVAALGGRVGPRVASARQRGLRVAELPRQPSSRDGERARTLGSVPQLEPLEQRGRLEAPAVGPGRPMPNQRW
ncbi:hypothetical protein FKM82_024359 [Ascaphus truei]